MRTRKNVLYARLRGGNWFPNNNARTKRTNNTKILVFVIPRDGDGVSVL